MADRFTKFTEWSRRVLSLAQEEAQRFNNPYIGTEHLLLGLVREDNTLGARVLVNLGIDLNKLRSAVESIIGSGDRPPTGEVGLTPRAKKVIELAIDEAHRMKHTHVGTEHLLIGLVREGEGIAAGLLESMGVNLERVRAETTLTLSQSGPQVQAPVGGTKPITPIARHLTTFTGAANARTDDPPAAAPTEPRTEPAVNQTTTPAALAPAVPTAASPAPVAAAANALPTTQQPAPAPRPPSTWLHNLAEAAFDITIAVTLALIAIALALPGLGTNPPINYDEGYVLQAPVNFLREGFYGTIDAEWRWQFDPHVTTGIPVLLPTAFIFDWLGQGVAQSRLIVVFYSGLAAAAAFAVARLEGGRAVAVIAALLVTFTLYPHDRTALGEVPSLALFLAGAWAWIASGRKPGRWPGLFLSGLLFGLAALTKMTMLPMILATVMVTWGYLRLRGTPLPVRTLLWPVVLTLLLVLAWFFYQYTVIGEDAVQDRFMALAGYQDQVARPTLARTILNLTRLSEAVPPGLLPWSAAALLVLALFFLGGERLRDSAVLPPVFLAFTTGFFLFSVGWGRYGFWMAAALALVTGTVIPTLAQRLVPHRAHLGSLVAAVALLVPSGSWALGKVAPMPDEAGIVTSFLQEQAGDDPIGATEWELDFTLNRVLRHPPTIVATVSRTDSDQAFDWSWPGMEWVAIGVVGISLGADLKLAENQGFVERLTLPHYRVFQRYRGPAPGWTWATVGATGTPPLNEAAAGQSFVAVNDVITEIRVLLAGGARATNASVKLRLYADPPAGEPLAEAELDGATVVQNRWYGFPMGRTPVKKGERYFFELTSQKAATQTAANSWFQDGADNYPEGQWSKDRKPAVGDLYFGILGFDRPAGS